MISPERTELNRFETKVANGVAEGLVSLYIDVMQVNVGLRCNQQCRHCHLDCSPQRTEVMDWPVMEMVLAACERAGAGLVDITGGAPELNPHLRQLVQAVRQDGREVQVRTNLTVLLEKGQEDTIDFLRRHGVRLIASMPCYLDENVTTQRGPGVYCRSVEAIRRLNEAGDLPPISVPT